MSSPITPATAPAPLAAPSALPLGRTGTTVRVWSAHATALTLCLLAGDGSSAIDESVPMTSDADGVWSADSELLTNGRRYAIQADGPDDPGDDFDPERLLLDPYGRAVERTSDGVWVSAVVDDAFDWGDVTTPDTPLDHTVIYELHVKGFTKLNELIPEHLRGTYAGLAHEAAVNYLSELGVTAIELLPVHASTSEDRLLKNNMTNYWGYNTLGYFAPHATYATQAARDAGPQAVLDEFKGMIKHLHAAGLKVLMDVVYNHTAEEGPNGPVTSFRGLDNRSYYRQDADGNYIDTTGCGNTVNTDIPQVAELVLDSLRYWSKEMRIDGFRFDLAATLGRDDRVTFDPRHPLLLAIVEDPDLVDRMMIAEPWDVGLGGWQTGNFPTGWAEWNDRYRDRMRTSWLGDIAKARFDGDAGSGIGRFASRFSGSASTFAVERGPLASVNFITAHDGFTMHDLVSYNVKHNLLNGEGNRDGSGNNASYNFGAEGPTTDPGILATRRRTIRNLLGTLLLSAGVPMLTAGDEFGRSQGGNNNAYCQDNETSWVHWWHEEWQHHLWRTSQHLLRLRRENPALRPSAYGKDGVRVPSASQMDWYDGQGGTMSDDEWNSPGSRTIQYVASSTPEHEEPNRILLIVHALEDDTVVRLPAHGDATTFELLWDSARDEPLASDDPEAIRVYHPGDLLRIPGTSMRLFRANPPADVVEPNERAAIDSPPDDAVLDGPAEADIVTVPDPLAGPSER